MLNTVRDKQKKKNQFKAKGMKGHFKGGAPKKESGKGGKRTINKPRSKNQSKRSKSRKGIV